jgi:hypothetical protein
MAYTPYMNPANRPDDITPPMYSGVGGGIQSQEVISTYDIYAPNELVQVFERHNHRPGFRVMLKSMGFDRGTAAPTTGHYEYPWRKDLVRVNSVITASTGPGTDVVIELTAGSMFDTQVSVSGAARKASYPIENEMVIGNDGKKAFISNKDVTTDPHRLTLTPVKSTEDIALSFVGGEAYFISDNAHGEGTGLPAGRTPRVIKYLNDFQIVKTACGSTGSEMTNQTYFQPIPGQEGSFYLQTKWSNMWTHEDRCDGALVWGQTIDNVTVNASELGHDVGVKGTEGFIDFTLLNGYESNYSPGSLAITDFNVIGGIYEAERVGVRNVMAWQGYNMYVELEDVLQNLLSGDVAALLMSKFVTYDGGLGDEFQPVDDKDFAMNIGFRALKKGGYDYSWMLLHAFNEAMGAGADVYDYDQWAIYHPLGFVEEKSSGSARATIGYEYKQLGNYSREVVIADISGVGVAGTGTPRPMAVNQFDVHKTGMLSEIAFHGACANHLIIQRP